MGWKSPTPKNRELNRGNWTHLNCHSPLGNSQSGSCSSADWALRRYRDSQYHRLPGTASVCVLGHAEHRSLLYGSQLDSPCRRGRSLRQDCWGSGPSRRPPPRASLYPRWSIGVTGQRAKVRVAALWESNTQKVPTIGMSQYSNTHKNQCPNPPTPPSRACTHSSWSWLCWFEMSTLG